MKMNVIMKKRVLLNLVILTVSVVPCALAVPTEFLPEGIYNGRNYFNGGRLDFAVYDTQSPVGTPTFEGTFGQAPGVGRFIYAYQLFIDSTVTTAPTYFAILGIGAGALANPANDNIGALTDAPAGSEGVAPDAVDPRIDPTETAGIWEFQDGALTGGKHSWFMVLRSDHAMTTTGSYTFNKDQLQSTTVPNPEPATLALFAGGFMLIRHTRRKRCF